MTRRAVAAWLVVATLVSGVAYGLYSQAGLSWTWQLVRPLLPGEIHVGDLEGRLAGPLRVRGLDWDAPGFRLRIERAELDWSPGMLLLATVSLDFVEGSGIRYAAKPAPSVPEAGPPPSEEGLGSPVYLHVRDLNLRDMEVRTAPEAGAFLVTRATGALGFGRQGAYLRDLTVTGDSWSVNGTGRADPAGEGSVDLDFAWHWQRPAGARLEGRGSLAGDRSRLRLRHELQAPGRLTLDARIRDPLDQPRWEAEVRGQDLPLSGLYPGLPEGTASLAGDLAGDLETAGGEVELDLQAPGVPLVHLTTGLRASLPGQRLELDRARLAAEGIPGQISGEGNLRWGTDPGLDFRGSWADLRWPFSGPTYLESPSGTWGVSGGLDGLRAELDGAVNGGQTRAAATWRGGEAGLALRWTGLTLPGWPGSRLGEGRLDAAGSLQGFRYDLETAVSPPHGAGLTLALRGTGTPEGLEVAELRAEAPEGRITGAGSLAWAPALAGRVDLRGEGLDPGLWLPAWPGRLALETNARARMEDGRLRLDLKRLEVSGRLRERDVALSGAGGYAEGRARLEGIRLRAGTTDLSLEGRWSPEGMDIQWQVASRDLDDLLPGARGSVEGRGSLEGSLPLPRIEARVTGKGLALGPRSLESLAADLRIDPGGEAPSRLQATFQDLRIPGLAASRMTLEGGGRPADHSLSLTADTDRGTLSLAFDGAWQEDPRRWVFRLIEGRVSPARFPTWTLANPASGRVGPEGATLEPACWRSDPGRLCLGGSWEVPGDARLSYRAEGIPLAYLLPLLPPDTGVEGTLSGNGELAYTSTGRVQGRARLATSSGRILHTAEPGAEPVTLLRFRPNRLGLEADGEALEVEASLAPGETDSVTARARLRQGPEPFTQWPLSGHLRLAVSDLGFLPLLVPQVAAVEGRADADLRLLGSLARPRTDGSLQVALTRLDLPTPGLTLKEVRLRAEPTAGDNLRLTGSARSGDGEVRLEGVARLTGPDPSLRARVRGEDFLAYNRRDARIWTSPDLGLVLAGDRIEVDGEIRIPRAEVTPQELTGTGAVTASPDQRIVRPGETEGRAVLRRISSRVRVILGKEVRVDAFGLTGRIEGDITVVEEPGKPTTASGELRTAEGRYQAYGQRLEIETGRLLFGGGPVTDPGLDVRAVRRPHPDIVVGIHARGPLREPEIQLFSEPAMSQTEQLSWLVLGRPLDQASSGEAEALNRAVLFLGMKGGHALAESIGTGLGLDEVRLETEPTAEGEQAALVLGKYLSPRLYVSYGIGLFQPINTLRLRYTLTRHWQVVTESNAEQTGGDLLFTIERGQ